MDLLTGFMLKSEDFQPKDFSKTASFEGLMECFHPSSAFRLLQSLAHARVLTCVHVTILYVSAAPTQKIL